MEILNFINGEFSPSQGSKKFEKISPFTGELLCEVTASEPMDVVLALPSVKKAQSAFEKTSRQERSDLLKRIGDQLESRADEIAAKEALHQGLSQEFVRWQSVQFAIDIFRQNAADLLQDFDENKVQYKATGLIGIILAWPLSLRLLTERLAPALAAGNGVLVKASELSPITGQIAGEILCAAGVPAGLVNILQGHADVANTLAGHPSIAAISMVGKNAHAESVMALGVKHFKKLQIAAGAKNPSIVLNDFDYKQRMPEILFPFLMGQGQLCWNSSRIFVMESFAKEFIEAAQNYLQSLKPLRSPQGDSVWSPLIHAESISQIQHNVDGAKTEHGKILFGGERADHPGFFYKPTLVLDMSNCSTLQQDEIHGPLLIVTPVKYQHDALKWANTSYLAQSGIIWGPTEKVHKVAGQLDVGQVWLNGWLSDGEINPIVGLKQSAFGLHDYSWKGPFFSEVKKLTE